MSASALRPWCSRTVIVAALCAAAAGAARGGRQRRDRLPRVRRLAGPGPRRARPPSHARSKFTLPVAVVAMRERSFGAIDYGALEAGVMVMALPCVILFLVLQRHYVQGFTSGALRG